MKILKIVKILAVSATILSLAACSAHKKQYRNGMDGSDGADGVQTAGLGQGENYGDSGSLGGGGNQLAKNTYYFDFDRSDIREEDRPAIIASAKNLATNPNAHVTLEGHTDPRGSREYNIALGERRAAAVANEMQAHGANPGQVRVVSYGAQKLASSGHSEEDYQQDRRAVIATR